MQEALLEDGTSVGKPDVVAGLFELIRTLRSAIAVRCYQKYVLDPIVQDKLDS